MTHPPWCSSRYCTAAEGGAHRSRPAAAGGVRMFLVHPVLVDDEIGVEVESGGDRIALRLADAGCLHDLYLDLLAEVHPGAT